MVKAGTPYGTASLYLADGVRFLNAEETVFQAMIEGWRDLHTGGRLNKKASVDDHIYRVKAFHQFSNEWPWQWSAGGFDEWMMHLVSVRKLLPSTIRAYQTSIRLFCDYICSPHYEWVAQCEAHFGTHPVQVCHEWNSSRHVLDYEGHPARRPLSREEVQRLFDYIDDEYERRIELRKKGALQVYRDATLFKVIYGWGLRADEAARLNITDFYRNPEAPEFGRFGMLHVRHGKGSRRRSVITLRMEAVEALKAYVEDVLPLVQPAGSNGLWFTERGNQLYGRAVTDRFGDYRDDVGLDRVLTPHCLRHSYATHLTEEGYNPEFIQRQLGHAWASTTTIYTHVSGKFMNAMMREAVEHRRDAASDWEEAR